MPIIKPSNQNVTVVATSNTTQGTSGTQAISNIVMAGAGNVSVGITNGSIVVSGVNDGVNIIAAGTQTAGTAGTVLFNNSNGISFGMSNSVVTASHNALVQSVADALYQPKFDGEPNGFMDRAKATLSWSNASRTLTVTPVGSYDIYSNGAKFTISTVKTFTISNADGAHFIYIDDTGALQEYTGVYDDLLIFKWCYVAYVYWNSSDAVAVPDVQNEQHGTDWPPEIHYQQHKTVGTRFESGADLSITLGSGTANLDLEFASTTGYIFDEDIRHEITARAYTDLIPVLYRNGGTGLWRYDETLPTLTRPSGTGRASFNEFTGVTWQKSEVLDGWYSAVYIYASPGITKRWFAVMGQTQYPNIDDARMASTTVPSLGSTLPFAEFKLIASAIFQTNDTFSNTTKSRLETVDDAGSKFVDWRRVAQTSPSAPLPYQTPVDIIAAGSTFSSGTATFGNANGFSFVGSNGSIVGSYTVPAVPAQTVQTQGLVSILGSSGPISFANGNGVSFGGNASTITASVAAGATATGNFGALGAGTQTATSGTVSFANSNGISFGMSGSNQITASYTVPAVPAQTVQTVGGYALGNTTGQSSSSTFDARSLSFSGAGVASIGYSGNAIIISVPSGGGGADGVNILAAGTQTANTTGTVAFVNSNNVSFGMSNSSRITASFSYSQSTAPSAISAGTAQATSGQVVLSNSNGISFGMNAGTITASYTVPAVPAQTVQTQGLVSVLGSSGAISFANGNGVSFGGNLNTVTASVAAGATATGNFGALGAGTQTATSGTVAFVNSNNVSFGMSNSSQLTASFSYSQSTAPSAISAGTTQATSGAVVFSNSNGVSFGMNAGTVTASYTVPTQTVQTQGLVSVLGSSGAISFANGNGISFGGNLNTVTASVGVGATATGNFGALGAGTQTATSGTVSFANSNGISFGMSGSNQITASYTVPSVAAGATATGNFGALGAGTQTATSGTVIFANSNNVSFGMSGSNQITASFSYSQSTAPSAISAGTTQATSGQVVLSNSNGISFGMNAGTVTASYTVPTVPAGATATGNFGALGAGTQTATSGTVSFANSNGISFGMSGSNQITASYTVPAVPAQTVQTIGGYAGGNTTGQSSSSTFDARSLSFSGAGIVSVGYSAGSVIISAVAAGGGDGVNILAAGTQTATSNGTIQFVDSNGISFGMSNNSRITASYTVPTQTVQTIGRYAVGNTVGQSSSSTADARSYSVSGAGIVSVGYSAGVLIVSASAAGAADGVNILAAGTQTANTTGTVAFVDSNGISFGMTNSSQITASVARSELTAGANITLSVGGSTVSIVGNSPIIITAGTNSFSSGAVQFANSNGISFGLNTTGVLTASHNGLTSQSNQAASGTNGSFTFQTLSHGNLNGISFYTSNSSIVASYTVPTVVAQTVQSYNLLAAGTQTANTTGTVAFVNSNNISFGMSNSSQITASFSYSQSTAPSAISAGTTQATSGAVVFSNSNGISFGMDAGTVTASYTVPTQSVQTQGLVSILGSSGAISFANGNGVSFGGNLNTVTASVGAGATATGNFGALGAGTQTATSGTVAFANSNGISFGMSGSSQITASYTVPAQTVQTIGAYAISNTIGQSSSSTMDARSISFVGAGVASVGYSAGSVIISVPSGGGAGDGVNILAAGTQTANTTGTVAFVNSNNVSFGMSNSSQITASFSYSQSTAPSAISAGTTQATSGQVVLSNSNGISFGMNAGTITASYTVPAQTVQTQGLVSVLGSSGAISFDNGNGVSFGGNANTVTASVAAGATATGNFGALGAGTQTASSGTVSFANSNGISFGMSGSNQITASYTVPTVPAGATATGNFGALGAGTQTASSGTVSFANSNGISFGMSGSNQITASYTVPAQTVQTLGGYAVGNTTGQSSSSTFDARSLSFSGAGIASVGYSGGQVIISVPAGGGGGGGGITWSYFNPTDGAQQVAGQQGQGTLHIQPAQIQNVQFDHIAFPINFSATTNNTGSITISQWLGLYTRNVSTLSLASSTLITQGITFSGTQNSSVNNGMRLLTGGWTGTILEGQYYIGIISRTTSGGANAATISQMLVSQIATAFSGLFGVASATSAQYTRGLGVYTATTTALPGSIGFDQIRGTGTLDIRRPLIYFYSQTF